MYNSRLEQGLMASTYNSGIHKFSVFVVFWTVLLFVAGALVTSKDRFRLFKGAIYLSFRIALSLAVWEFLP